MCNFFMCINRAGLGDELDGWMDDGWLIGWVACLGGGCSVDTNNLSASVQRLKIEEESRHLAASADEARVQSHLGPSSSIVGCIGNWSTFTLGRQKPKPDRYLLFDWCCC